MSVQQLLKASTAIIPAGEQLPWLEGKRLTKENIKVFIKEYDEYCDQMRWSVSGEMPPNSVAVFGPMGCSQRRVIRDANNGRMELTIDQSCMIALKKT